MTDKPKGAPTSEEAVRGSDALDSALVAAALLDGREFSRIYDRYADRLYAYALERIMSPAIAEDIVGDTLMTAFERLDRFDPERGSLAGWLFTIARHRIADQHRQRARFWKAVGRQQAGQTVEPDPLEAVIRREAGARVRSALGELSMADRDLVLLRYSAGLNSREIAAVLGISHGAVRMRLNRARKHLAMYLGDDR